MAENRPSSLLVRNDAPVALQRDERDGNSVAPARARHLSTNRVRLYRERQRQGLTVVRLELFSDEIDDLAANGFLAPDKRHDKGFIAEAIGQLLDEVCPALHTGRLRFHART
ncbi:MAG: hypothetical protein ACRECV_00540 [Xanthobacteraceae bacterium]